MNRRSATTRCRVRAIHSLCLVLALALLVACGSGPGPVVRTVAQKIDDAAAVIAKATKTTVADVKSTFRTSLRPATDESLLASLEGVAAKPTWTTKAWSLVKKTVEVAKTDEVKFVSGLVCDGLEELEKSGELTKDRLRAKATLRQPFALASTIDRVVNAAYTTLERQSEGGIDYVVWVRITTCVIDKAPD